MFSPGIRNPQRSLLICIGVTVAAGASIAWGVMEMQANGEETLGSGLKIGLAMLPAMLAPLMALNFLGAMKVFASMRRGDNRLAHWSVSAPELSDFVASNNARNALRGDTINDWEAPRAPPADGVEVIFTPDAVLVGDTYFALIRTGLYRITGVWMQPDGPPTLTFRTLNTYANRFGTRTTAGELRIPVAHAASAEAAKVVTHFQRVLAGEVIANPDFYKRRMRIGLIAAPIFLAIAGLGFALRPVWKDDGSGVDATILIAIGLVLAIASLILALAAKLLDNTQRRKG